MGISGGVDSAVSAYLLKQQGYEVDLAFMNNFEGERCTSEDDYAMAEQVADHLQLPLQVVNFAAEYWQRVFTNFLDKLALGLTPNPDVLCNSEIKFKAFLDYALSQGYDAIATGHYAGIDPQGRLACATDSNKDQTYFLCQIKAEVLSKVHFPLAKYHKNEVKKLAEEIGLPNHHRRESMGICFIGKQDFKSFLSEYLLDKAGDIVTTTGEVIGQHRGLFYYTIGQRSGIGLGGDKHREPLPWYVVAKNHACQQLIVAQGANHPRLFHNALLVHDIHWIGSSPNFPWSGQARIRHRQPLQSCQIISTDTGYKVMFSQQQRAITPGQIIAFYREGLCLGGGEIIEAVSEMG